MELKFKEVSDKFNTQIKDIKIKPFYTFAEKYTIYSDMMEKQSAIEREFSKVVLTCKLNTNLDVSELDDIAIYDLCSELGLIYEFAMEIDGYNELDKLVKDDESVYKAFEMLSKQFNIDKFSETLNQAKEVIK